MDIALSHYDDRRTVGWVEILWLTRNLTGNDKLKALKSKLKVTLRWLESFYGNPKIYIYIILYSCKTIFIKNMTGWVSRMMMEIEFTDSPSCLCDRALETSRFWDLAWTWSWSPRSLWVSRSRSSAWVRRMTFPSWRLNSHHIWGSCLARGYLFSSRPILPVHYFLFWT